MPFSACLRTETSERCTEAATANTAKSVGCFNSSVLGKVVFSSGRYYDELQVEGVTCWELGVAGESIDRKGLSLSPENGFWTVGL
jgi:hypothetical protein